MKAFFLFVLFVLFTGAGIAVAVKNYVEPQLKLQVEQAARENCPFCQFHLGDLSLSLLVPGRIVFYDIDFSYGDPAATQTTAKIGETRFQLSLPELLQHRLHFENVMLENFSVTVTDGDQKSPTVSVTAAEPKPDYEIYVDPVQFSNGTFQYIRNHDGTTAVVHVNEIDAQLSTLSPGANEFLRAVATARYENSGHCELQISTNPFKKPLDVHIKLAVKDQDLSDLSLFFDPNAGVEMKGKIIDGVGEVFLSGDRLKATDWIVYEGLEAKVKKRSDRSGFSAFFQNLGMDLSMQLKNTELERSAQTKSVELSQENDESIVSFVLRGLKEAAMKVATRSNR